MYFWQNRVKPKTDTDMREVVKEIRDSLQTGVTNFLRDSVPVYMAQEVERQRKETIINNFYREKLNETELYTPSQLDSAVLDRFGIDLTIYRSERTSRPDR